MSISSELTIKALGAIYLILYYLGQDVPGFKEEQRNRYNCNEKSHPLCEKCKDLCKCGSVVTKCPSPVVHQILKDLPMFCPHYKKGSREVFARAENLEEHLMDCVFRPVSCPILFCKELNPFKDITDHLLSSHSKSVDLRNHSVKLSLAKVSHSFFLMTNSSEIQFTTWLRKFEFSGTMLQTS